jgi:hypothetical protein
MTELIAVETNCETGETTTRPFTSEEVEIYKANVAAHEAEQAQAEIEAKRVADLKASAKAKLISGSPLTEEEASVLVI